MPSSNGDFGSERPSEPPNKYLGLPKDQWESSTPHVTEVTENDVVLGRGTQETKGNKRFQNLLEKIYSTYQASPKNVKDVIVRSLHEKITTLGGKFLRPIDSAVELTLLGA